MSCKITYAKNLTLISLSSLPCDNKVFATVLKAFSEKGINLDMISQTARKGGTLNMSVTLSDNDLAEALSVLGELRAQNIKIKPEILPSSVKVNFYDKAMINTPGVATRVFTALAQADVEIMMVGTSDVDISVLVSAYTMDEAIAALTAEFGVEAEDITL